MFRINGNLVEILHYKITYTQKNMEKDEKVVEYAHSEEEANEIALLTGGKVELLPSESDAWMDGIKVENVPDTYAEALKIKAEFNSIQEYLTFNKLNELSQKCNSAISSGCQVQLSDGSIESFTYGIVDQSNVSEMFNAVLLGATEYPYHANNDDCRMYSAQDIVTIYATLSAFKTGQTTYHNQLKRYTKALTTQEEIQAVTYGQDLTGEYLESYNTLMAQAKVQLDNILAKVAQTEALSS